MAVIHMAGMTLHAGPLKAAGIAVVFEGQCVASNAPVYEYSMLRMGEGSFSLTLTNGKRVAGLSGHLVARYEYATPPSHKALATIEDLSRSYVKSKTYLAPRIAQMKEQLRKAEFEASIAGDKKPPAILVAEMTVKGKTYQNVRVSSLKDGRFQFLHDEGGFSLPALSLSRSLLTKMAQSTPEIADTHDFRTLLDTYVPSVTISGKSVTGVRIVKREGEKLFVETDDGPYTMEESALSVLDLEKLESAAKRYANLSRKFRAAQGRQVKDQDDYFIQAEQEQ